MISNGIYGSNKKKVLLVGDIFLVFFAFSLAASLKLIAFESFSIRLIMAKVDWMVVMWMLLYPITLYVFELYNQEKWKHNVRLFVYISFAVIVASGIVGFMSYMLIPDIIIGRTILFVHMIFSIILIFTWRKIFNRFFLNGNNGKDKILLIGNSLIIDDIETVVKKNADIRSDDLAVIREYSENPGTVIMNGALPAKSLPELVTHYGFKTVVVAEQLEHLPLLRKQLLDLRFSGVAIYDAPCFYEALTNKVPVNQVRENCFLFRNQGEAFNPPMYRRIKKVLDQIIALFGIIISFPLMLISVLAIKLTSKGPVFFKQERLGKKEQPFILMKLRTMINNAEKENGPQWACENDCRITKIGRILRKTHLDELPQLFNILKGEMSFVGPRPIRRYFADLLAKDIPHYRIRFVVKPGLTGWAQVRGDYAGSDEGQAEKLEYDLYYIQNQSILFDLFIVLKTVQTVLFRRGQ